MSLLLDIARVAAIVNIVLLLSLVYVWLPNYRRHGAPHTLGLLVFSVFLLLQNSLWIYLYGFHGEFIGWFLRSDLDIQVGVTLLCALETLALLFLVRITWR
ncbi:hypothetical protein [Natronocalculus amylovorans]|uniref:Uncharacterized protein n=1 Tax=Natronocalculus amylovorans TaxID=2917812 RepID=A0AAE3FWH3_9EURY|nr:hypothetical protein [Natronocalculus amylovorans]MCL9816200.1 hypothetical protein [Natronocalculus amylovorans]NUE03299.1 hypothetical protein [Halorubraceae archaeon YAN]